MPVIRFSELGQDLYAVGFEKIGKGVLLARSHRVILIDMVPPGIGKRGDVHTTRGDRPAVAIASQDFKRVKTPTTRYSPRPGVLPWPFRFPASGFYSLIKHHCSHALTPSV